MTGDARREQDGPSWWTTTPRGISTLLSGLRAYELVGLRKKKGSVGVALLSSLMCAA